MHGEKKTPMILGQLGQTEYEMRRIEYGQE